VGRSAYGRAAGHAHPRAPHRGALRATAQQLGTNLFQQIDQVQTQGGTDAGEDLGRGLLAAAFDLRQVRQRHAGSLRDVLQRAALLVAQPPQHGADG
jgi:hypothetical protein